MTRTDKRRGFTLVEMLVVISIIVVLVAILFPVFSSARERSRQVRCQTNLSKIVGALQDYKRQYHRYPPRPAYDATLEIYTGGFSALYPDFISDYSALVCPDDIAIASRNEEAKQRRYSTYNGVIELIDNPSAADPWVFAADSTTGNQKITYNYNGYDELGWDMDVALDPRPPTSSPKPAWLDRGWKYYPRLMNIYAPEYTVVTHCTAHRTFYSNEDEVRDTCVNLGSETDTLLVKTWQDTTSGASLFEKQEQ